MNDKLRTPTLAEFKNAGYYVNVKHNRAWKMAHILDNGKLKVDTVLAELSSSVNDDDEPAGIGHPAELLPKGGKTEVWVTDPDTSAEFYGFGMCHPEDNYSKSEGVKEALKKITALMLVVDGTEDSIYVHLTPKSEVVQVLKNHYGDRLKKIVLIEQID